MRIAFYHGLESTLPSSKVEWLKSLRHEVLALDMNYRDPECYAQTLEKTTLFKPNLVIGSSMGGWFAWLIGAQLDVSRILLNPALHSRSFDPVVNASTPHFPLTFVLLGENDTVIDPTRTTALLIKTTARVTTGSHAHRTPLEVFQPFTLDCITQLSGQ